MTGIRHSLLAPQRQFGAQCPFKNTWFSGEETALSLGGASGTSPTGAIRLNRGSPVAHGWAFLRVSSSAAERDLGACWWLLLCHFPSLRKGRGGADSAALRVANSCSWQEASRRDRHCATTVSGGYWPARLLDRRYFGHGNKGQRGDTGHQCSMACPRAEFLHG